MHSPILDRTNQILTETQNQLNRRTDSMFGVLFVIQLMGCIITALVFTPRTWAGDQSSVHIHVWAGLGLGTLLCAMPIYLVLFHRGQTFTRYGIVVAQMLYSSLLIHLSGGRIETHFHLFGSLAFIAFYRDWRLFIPATLIITVDHLTRAIYWPESVFGVLVASPWRAIEHAGWVLFEDIFLIIGCIFSAREMVKISSTQAKLEYSNSQTEQIVAERTQELRTRGEELARSEERFRLAVQGSQDGLWDWDLKNNTVYYAPRWKELLGCEEHEISDSLVEWFSRIVSEQLARFYQDMNMLRSGEIKRLDTELEIMHADGNTRWMLCRATAERDANGNATRLAGSMADISDLKHAQERLRQLAHHDRLTGLPNRGMFITAIDEELRLAKKDPGYQFAVLFGDFDGFKIINDSLGHAFGDSMLIHAGGMLSSHVMNTDVVSRFGGDEFAVLLRNVKNRDAENIAQRLVDSFSQPYEIDEHEITSTLSLGLVVNGSNHESADDMLRDADAAMYQAKNSGKSRWQLFDESMHKAAMKRLDLERELRRATSTMQTMDHEFKLLYQPIIDLESGEIAGFEALVRWEHPVLGLIQPDQFIPVAEDIGSIILLGEWTLRVACEQVVRWREEFGQEKRVYVNVNLSRRQLAHNGLIPLLKNTIRETGVRPEDLKLEITETTVMDARVDVIQIMNRIRSLGIELAIDDFGTGHSSLSCLRDFPIQVLKIDRAFMLNMSNHREFCALVHAIVSLAHNFDLQVVAEGIEDYTQVSQLQAMDCSYAQGYFFSRPVDSESATKLLRDGLSSDRIAA